MANKIMKTLTIDGTTYEIVDEKMRNSVVELTQAEYDALGDIVKTDGKTYYITDSDGGSSEDGDRINNLAMQIAVERGRIDALASLKDGSTTGDAELQDIRVGYDGTVYNTAGDAVRAQIGHFSNDVASLTRVQIITWGDDD